MPLYMDVHRGVDADLEAAIEAHRMDLEVQEEYEVDYRRYWIDEEEGVIFCLFEAPSKAAGEAVHRESHGLLAEEIYQVEEGK